MMPAKRLSRSVSAAKEAAPAKPSSLSSNAPSRRRLARAAPAALFTHEAKKSEAGLADAAKALGLPLVFLEAEVLRQASLRAATNSPRVMAMFGLPSIAEAAALAGAGPSSVLLVARISNGGASCAVAGKRQP